MSEDEREKEFSTVLAESVVATDLFEVKNALKLNMAFYRVRYFQLCFRRTQDASNIDLAEESTH